MLRQTASSVNIKERLDFSCAIFDGEARLVAHAPHMPVHLGSMGASVAAVRVMGYAVIGGMIAATTLAIFLIPVSFYVFEKLAKRSEASAKAAEEQNHA